MAAATYLYVDRPVASLQCDLDTPAGTATLDLDPSLQKQIMAAPVNGKLRVLVFGLNQSVFSGRFASVDAAVSGISGVVGANPDASDAGAIVTKLSKPIGLRYEV
jgi:hypothetical protein